MQVTPKCIHFEQCGGCDLQYLSYQSQLELKLQRLRDILSPLVGSDFIFQPILSDPLNVFYYRNKIRFGFLEQADRIYPTRHQKNSDNAEIPITECHLQTLETVRIAQFVADFALKHQISIYQSNRGFLKHLLIKETRSSHQAMLSLVTNQGNIPDLAKFINSVTTQFPQIKSIYQTITKAKNNQDFHDILLWGEPRIEESIGRYKFQISPHAFFQTNSILVEKLYQQISDYSAADSQTVIWDIYAGSATIGICLSQNAKQVVSIESNPQNIEDAKINISINQINNLELVQGKVEELLTNNFIIEHKPADVIVVDPPRAGLDQRLLNILPHLNKHRLVYVSCNPLTLERDLRFLVKKGYQIQNIQGVDMFPQTNHLEVICLLTLS